MMALTIKEVEHVAMLCRLRLAEDEKERMAEQLSAVLDYMDKLNEVDTSQVDPMAHVLPLFNVFRPDEERQESSREEMLANAPLVEDGMFKVPRIV